MITFLIATMGRDSISKTLDSIECWPGDEILVVGADLPAHAYHPYVRHIPCEPGGDWGHSERNYAMPLARGRYIAHIDDDDIYAQGTRAVMADAIQKTPDRPVLFRMQYPNGVVLWNQPSLCLGNVGTPMMLIPNHREKFGTFGPFNGGDCHFLNTMGWRQEEIVWRPEIIALLGHD